MSIYDFMDNFIDSEYQEIELFDVNTDKTIYRGSYGNMPERYQFYAIQSIDNIDINTDHITINIDTADE